MLSKEPYILWLELYILSKEPCILSVYEKSSRLCETKYIFHQRSLVFYTPMYTAVYVIESAVYPIKGAVYSVTRSNVPCILSSFEKSPMFEWSELYILSKSLVFCHPIKSALYSTKGALHSIKRALYCISLLKEPFFVWSKLYVLSSYEKSPMFWLSEL